SAPAGNVAGAAPPAVTAAVQPAGLSASGYPPSRWAQALQAELAGNVAEAAQAYAAAAQDFAATNPRLATECQDRAQWLREGRRSAAPAGRPVDAAAGGTNTWGAPPPVPATVASLPGGANAQHTAAREPAAPPAPAQFASLPPPAPRPVPDPVPA